MEDDMPIKGLTDQRRMPRLGKIHLGIKAQTATGTQYPKAVDYFVCPPEVQVVYGEKPKSLDIVFPTDDEALIASQFYRAYSRTRGLVCKGDGDTAMRVIDLATKRTEDGTGVVTGDIAGPQAKETEWVEGITCPGRDCPYYQHKDCREIMNLQFLLPKVPGLGVWQLDTSSWNTIVNTNSALALIRKAFGQVGGLPLLLTVVPHKATVEGRSKTVYVLNISTKATLAQLALAREKPMYALLPQGDVETPELLFPTPAERAAQQEAETVEVGSHVATATADRTTELRVKLARRKQDSTGDATPVEHTGAAAETIPMPEKATTSTSPPGPPGPTSPDNTTAKAAVAPTSIPKMASYGDVLKWMRTRWPDKQASNVWLAVGVESAAQCTLTPDELAHQLAEKWG